MAIIINANKCSDRNLNFSFFHDIMINTGKMNMSNKAGNHKISKMAPTKAK